MWSLALRNRFLRVDTGGLVGQPHFGFGVYPGAGIPVPTMWIRPLIPRLSAFLRKKTFPIPSPGLPLLVDEEISPVYDSKCFYLVKPGEVVVLTDRY